MSNTSTDILLAGAFAALTIDILIYPLDTIKTRIQSPSYQKLYTSHGRPNVSLFRGLYQGLGTIVLATIPSSGAFFTTYEGTKSVLQAGIGGNKLPTPVTNSLASCTAELVSCLILTPAEVLKQNAQVFTSHQSQSSSSSSPTSNSSPSSTPLFDSTATRRTFAKFRSNPLALWRGYTALAARNLPFTAMQFPLFEHLKTYFLERRERQGKRSGTLLEKGTVTAISAGLAGSGAAVLTTPVDVVKTRVMLGAAETERERSATSTSKSGNSEVKVNGSSTIANTEKSGASGPGISKETVDKRTLAQVERLQDTARRKGGVGSLDIAREVYRSEGVRGLFRGGALRGIWTALGSGLYLAMYECSRTYLERRRERIES